jgi:hypothetical protein
VEVSLFTATKLSIGLFQENEKVEKSDFNSEFSGLHMRSVPTIDDIKRLFKIPEEEASETEKEKSVPEGDLDQAQAADVSLTYSFSTGKHRFPNKDLTRVQKELCLTMGVKWRTKMWES